MKRFDRRYAGWLIAVGLLLTLPAFAGFTGFAWELAQLSGLLAAVGCIALCGAALRPRDATPPTLLTLRGHTLIGWYVLATAGVHVAGLAVADHWVIEYFKPSLPLYMLAGFIGVLLLMFVAPSAMPGIRRRLWKSHRGFQATHVIGGVLAMAFVVIHVIVTARYAAAGVRAVLMIAAASGAVLLLLRRRRPNSSTQPTVQKSQRLVFGRHTTVVLVVLVSIAVGLLGLLAQAANSALREPVADRLHTIPLDFPHTPHVQVNCITCHHNFSDGRGFDNCVVCHQSARADLKVSVEPRFHGFCLDCHRHAQTMLQPHGPVSGCASCHHAVAHGR